MNEQLVLLEAQKARGVPLNAEQLTVIHSLIERISVPYLSSESPNELHELCCKVEDVIESNKSIASTTRKVFKAVGSFFSESKSETASLKKDIREGVNRILKKTQIASDLQTNIMQGNLEGTLKVIDGISDDETKKEVFDIISKESFQNSPKKELKKDEDIRQALLSLVEDGLINQE